MSAEVANPSLVGKAELDVSIELDDAGTRTTAGIIDAIDVGGSVVTMDVPVNEALAEVRTRAEDKSCE